MAEAIGKVMHIGMTRPKIGKRKSLFGRLRIEAINGMPIKNEFGIIKTNREQQTTAFLLKS